MPNPTRPSGSVRRAWTFVLKASASSIAARSLRPSDAGRRAGVSPVMARRSFVADRAQVVRGAPVVRVDRGEDLEVPRPAVEGDQTEPELLLRAAVEERPPARVVVLAEPRMRHREPGG